MKKFKPFVITSLTAICILGCDDKPNKDADIIASSEPAKTVAIEIDQEKQSYRFIESVFGDNNNEFLQGSYIQSIPQKIRAMRIVASEAGDTIKNADEIPLYASEEINQKIYVDGTYRYLNLNTTPSDSNILNDLNIQKQPVGEIATKTILMDGVAYLYNRTGELIQTEKTGDINYSALLDSIKSAFAEANKGGSLPQGVKALQDRRLTKAINSAKASGMRMISQTDNEIVMEMNLGVTNEISLPQRVNTPVQKRALMRFSGDMTRMLEQKIYEDNQLVQSVTYLYQNDDQLFAKNAPATIRSFLPDLSIKEIQYKSLRIKNDGVPYIVVSKETYRKNKLTINL
jgi:hypothetical protein